jgi:hypothetical protein
MWSSPCHSKSAIAYQNKEVGYALLFEAAAETLKTIARDSKHLGAEIGFTLPAACPSSSCLPHWLKALRQFQLASSAWGKANQPTARAKVRASSS